MNQFKLNQSINKSKKTIQLMLNLSKWNDKLGIRVFQLWVVMAIFLIVRLFINIDFYVDNKTSIETFICIFFGGLFINNIIHAILKSCIKSHEDKIIELESLLISFKRG